MNTFIPDLIIEVTSACNRSCSGCYAPNVVSTESARDLMEQQPNLFLSVSDLEKTIMTWDQSLPETISIRGGEPSLHPQISEILKAIKFFGQKLVFETHGRWLLAEQRSQYESLISSIVSNDAIVKISFDSMHRLAPEKLKEITTFLEDLKIRYLVAVTEMDENSFLSTRSLASWVPNSAFIFQKKAGSADELVKPNLGVINVSGKLVGGLNNKFSSDFDLKAVIG